MRRPKVKYFRKEEKERYLRFIRSSKVYQVASLVLYFFIVITFLFGLLYVETGNFIAFCMSIGTAMTGFLIWGQQLGYIDDKSKEYNSKRFPSSIEKKD